MPSRRHYAPQENWERWTNDKKKKIKKFKKMVKLNAKVIKTLEETISLVESTKGKIPHLKEGVPVKKQYGALNDTLEGFKMELNRTRERFYDKLNWWSEYIQDRFEDPDSFGFPSYASGRGLAENDSSIMSDFVTYVNETLDQWDDLEEEEQSNTEEHSSDIESDIDREREHRLSLARAGSLMSQQ